MRYVGYNHGYIAGTIHYELDSYLEWRGEEGEPLPSHAWHRDEYEWEMNERDTEVALFEQLRSVESGAAKVVSSTLLEALDDDELAIIQGIIWEKKSLAEVARSFPQHDVHGELVIDHVDEDGATHYKYHDHKWVQRRYNRALKKMRRASHTIALDHRLQAPHHIPAARDIGSITERIDHESSEGPGNEARILVRRLAQGRRVFQPATS